MKGEVIRHIFKPLKENDWIILKTNENVYSLRLGGFKKEIGPIQIFNYEEISFPYKNFRIQKVLTDDEWVYIILDNGGVIASGWINVRYSGEMELGVKFTTVNHYDKDFFLTDFSELITDNEGWSKRVK